MDEQVAAKQIVLATQGNEGIGHEQILVPLVVYGRLGVLHREAPQGGIGVFAGSGVLGAVGDVLGGVVDEIKVILPDGVVGRAEPGQVKGTQIQLVLRQGGVAGDHSPLLVVELLVHMGHEVVAHRREGIQSQVLAHQGNPFGGVQSGLHETFFGDLLAVQRSPQSLHRLTRGGNTHRQQVGEGGTAILPYAVAVVGGAIQGILAQGGEDGHEVLRAVDAADAAHALGIGGGAVTAPKLGIYHHRSYGGVDLGGVLQ